MDTFLSDIVNIQHFLEDVYVVQHSDTLMGREVVLSCRRGCDPPAKDICFRGSALGIWFVHRVKVKRSRSVHFLNVRVIEARTVKVRAERRPKGEGTLERLRERLARSPTRPTCPVCGQEGVEERDGYCSKDCCDAMFSRYVEVMGLKTKNDSGKDD